MFKSLLGIVIIVGAGLLWLSGLRLFLHSELSRTRKVVWTTILLLAGTSVGILLPLNEVWRKFIFLIVLLPVIGLVDLLLLRSRRGLAFWIRACGFEVCTAFGAAAATRYLLDLAGVTPFVLVVK